MELSWCLTHQWAKMVVKNLAMKKDEWSFALFTLSATQWGRNGKQMFHLVILTKLEDWHIKIKIKENEVKEIYMLYNISGSN